MTRHTCHWPGCQVAVPPRLWGCRAHWFALPRRLRAAIWRTYRPGQELTKDPSPAYLAAAKEAEDYARGVNAVERVARTLQDGREPRRGYLVNEAGTAAPELPDEPLESLAAFPCCLGRGQHHPGCRNSPDSAFGSSS